MLEHNKTGVSKKDKNYNKIHNHKIRMEIFEFLGNKCSNPNCLVPNGCIDIRCLQIDHVHGGGLREKIKIVGKNGNLQQYRFILRQIKLGSKDYQLLCANCNWIKRYENNETR